MPERLSAIASKGVESIHDALIETSTRSIKSRKEQSSLKLP